jgi:hypothetical protein
MKERPKVLANWDDVQHEPISLPPDDFSSLEQDDAVALIRDWFFDNFEDPAHSTPYESAEGGYQYIWGGPYNTRDIVENVFADTASAELIEAAIDEIEVDGMEWVPSSRRRLPPEEDDLEPVDDPAKLHADMLRRIGELEQAVEKARATPGIGHNNPPDAIEQPTLSTEDAREIKALLAELKQQPVAPTDDGKAAQTAVDGLRQKAARLKDFITIESAKEAVKYAAGGLLVWLVPKVEAVIIAALKWISSLGIGF